MATHSSFLSGESPWAEEPGVLQSIAHRELDPTDATIHTCLGLLMSFPGGSVVKNLPAVQETWVQFLSCEDPLEEEMTTHSNILAWEILWTEEPGRLQSVGLQESDTT